MAEQHDVIKDFAAKMRETSERKGPPVSCMII
jgi:hypothetical protein